MGLDHQLEPRTGLCGETKKRRTRMTLQGLLTDTFLRVVSFASDEEAHVDNIIRYSNGFYDDDLEFVQLKHVQIVSSMAPASTLGRHPLATRLTAKLRVCGISYPTMEELIEVYPPSPPRMSAFKK